MSVIRLLPDHIANQIAAGEVIQRPASVVKELVENAIDAGAEKIQVHIKDSGKTLIHVFDTGSGMSEQDARMSFERHATSKVSSAEDLFALSTKGFRGEALASIAAIAHVDLKTKESHSEVGTFIRIEGSKVITQEEIVCANGSSFEVKNLFYNVPARRNFLKSDQVEFRHICDEFERIVLAHPDIEFSLSHNAQIIYNLPATNLRKRITDVFGGSINDKLVPIEESTDIVKIHGFVGKPEHAKKKRGEQFFFVNNRFFKDTYFNHALMSAFDNLIAPKHYPSYFLFFEIDPERIDVNVHPTKTEIKFEEDRFIYSILKSSVKQALGKYNISPTLDFERETGFDLPYDMRNQDPKEPQIKVDTSYNPFNSSSGNGKSGNTAIKNAGFGSSAEIKQEDWSNFYQVLAKDEPEQLLTISDEEANILDPNKNYLQKGAYLITESKSGLLLINRRRAMHRILYDEMMQQFISLPIASQTMLFPIEKSLTKREASDLEANESLLQRLGFQWTTTEETLEVTAIPSALQQEVVINCLDDIMTQFSFGEVEKGDIAHHIINSISRSAGMCKLEKMNESALEEFTSRLFACPDHMYNPDGNKIMSTLSMEEIQTKF